MMVPFLEGALSLEETDHFLKHIKECSGCREDLEIYYTVRTAIDGMDQDRFKTYNLKQQFSQFLLFLHIRELELVILQDRKSTRLNSSHSV